MSVLSDFYPYVLPEVPGCPEVTADVALRSTMIEFCEKTLVIQRDLDPTSVVKGTIDYDLEPPDNTLVTRILRAWYKGNELHPVAPDFIEKPEVYNSLFVGADKGRADPRVFLQKDERTITIYPIPVETVANALTLRVALKPTRAAETFEDVLFEDYAETIAQGAKYRLLSMAGKVWTNGPAAAALLTMYNSGMNVARQRASRGHTRAELRVRMTGV